MSLAVKHRHERGAAEPQAKTRQRLRRFHVGLNWLQSICGSGCQGSGFSGRGVFGWFSVFGFQREAPTENRKLKTSRWILFHLLIIVSSKLNMPSASTVPAARSTLFSDVSTFASPVFKSPWADAGSAAKISRCSS